MCIIEWHEDWCDFKTRYQKDTCLKEFGLNAKNMTTRSRLDSQYDLENLYDHSINAKISILILEIGYSYELQKL